MLLYRQHKNAFETEHARRWPHLQAKTGPQETNGNVTKSKVKKSKKNKKSKKRRN